MKRECRLCAGEGYVVSPAGDTDACGACGRVAEAAWRAARRGGTSGAPEPSSLSFEQRRQLGIGHARAYSLRDAG